MIRCAYDELVELERLVEHPENTNRHSVEQIERMAEIIDFQGMRNPIVVSLRSGYMTKGHCRLYALRKLGWEKAPVDYQEYESKAQELADITADNEIGKWGELDFQKAIDQAEKIKDEIDLSLLGIKNFEIPTNPVNDIEIEEKEKKKTKKLCPECGCEL